MTGLSALHQWLSKSKYQITLLLLMLILTIQPISVLAQSNNEGLSMKATPAFQGYFKYGEWLPIWVELENSGPDLSGEVNVRVGGSGGTMVFSVPVELPTISRKRLSLFVLPNNYTRQLDVQFFAEGELKASQQISVQPQPNISYIIGLISPQRGALALINGIQFPGGMSRPVILADLALSEFPSRFEGLRSFDCIVINELDTSGFSPEQGQALENWVRQGGRLVIGGGAGMQRTVSGLPESLLPFIPETSIEIEDIAGIASLIATSGQSLELPEIRVPGPFVLATGSLSHGRLLIAQADLPLIVESSLGSGYIDMVMLDLSISPFDAWSGTTQFWQQLLSPGAAFPNWMPSDISARQQLANQMPYSLSNLPMLDLPSTRALVLLLSVYILMVGPVNYLFLRWKKRLHLAWVTIPAITVIFSIGSFSLGYVMHGTDVFLNKIAVIELQSDGKALVSSYLGLFSPGQRAYKVEVDGNGLISPLSPYYNPWDTSGSGINSAQEVTLLQGNPGYISGLSIEQWSMQAFMVEGMLLDFGNITSDVHLENDRLVGTVNNLTGYTIHDAAIIWMKRFTKLGDLVPGQSIEISLSLTDLSQPNFGFTLSYMLFEDQFIQQNTPETQRAMEVKRSILEGILERTPPYKSSISSATGQFSPITQNPLFIGWIDQAPPNTRVAGDIPAQQTTGLVLMSIPYNIINDQVVLPAGLVPGEVIAYPIDGGSCGDAGSPAIYLNRAEGYLRFTIPTQFREFLIENLSLSIWSDSNWIGSPAVAFLNWDTMTWIETSNLSQGINRISNSANLVGPDGSIQVRITGKENMQACFYIGLGLEGQKK